MSRCTSIRGFAPTFILALLLAGCGGSSSSTAPPAIAPGEGTAMFRVDVATGRVTVTPLTGELAARAVMTGHVITFKSSKLTVHDAATNTRALRVQLTNNLNEPIGGKYVRVVISNVRTEPATGTAVQLFNTFTAYGTGDGVEPYLDYPLTSGPLASKASTVAIPWVFSVPAGTQRFSFIATAEAALATPRPPEGAVLATHPRAHVQTVVVTSANGPSHVASQLDGPAGSATLNQRTVGIDVASDGAVFLSSYRTVRRYDPRTGRISTIAGDPAKSGIVVGSGIAGDAARFSEVACVAAARPDLVFVSDWYGNRIYLLKQVGADPAAASSWTVSHILGTGTPGLPDGGSTSPIGRPYGLAVSGDRTLWFVDDFGRINRAISGAGDITNRLNWLVKAVGGTAGAGASDVPSRFNNPWDIVAINTTDAIVADRGSNKLRHISWDGVVSTFVGPATPGTISGYVDGAASAARFIAPGGIARDQAGNIYTADANGLRRISPSGDVTTIMRLRRPVRDGFGNAGTVGGAGGSFAILGLSVGPDGDIWFVDEAGLRRVSRVLASPTS